MSNSDPTPNLKIVREPKTPRVRKPRVAKPTPVAVVAPPVVAPPVVAPPVVAPPVVAPPVVAPPVTQRFETRGRPKMALNGKLGVVDQCRVAARNPLPTTLGGMLGAVVPFGTYQVAHHDLAQADWSSWGCLIPALLVLGGLCYSATTVVGWGRLAFGSTVKAVGFAVLLEGLLIAQSQQWLGVVALVYLCMINAVATGVTLTRGSRAGSELE
jgi:hypothetical protein